LLTGGEPIERRWNWLRGGDGVDKGASDELGRRISIDGSEQMDINEMVNEVGVKLKGATSGQHGSVIGW
jgi:hypothetical protein